MLPFYKMRYHMNVENFLDAIEVIVNKRVSENNTQIYTGVVVKDNSVLKVKVKNKIYDLPVYGGKKFDLKEGVSVKVFIPQGQMSQAFILI